MSFSKLLVIVPTYNERQSIGYIIPEILKHVPEAAILVVDDNSPDGTADQVLALKHEYQNVHLLVRNQKTGLGDAYKHAYQYFLEKFTHDVVVTMDADGSHNPQYIPLMLQEIKEYDLVIGSRYVRQGGTEDWELWRKMLSKFGNVYAQVLSGIRVKDLTAGFICVRRSVIAQIDFAALSSAGYAYQIEFKYQCIHEHHTQFKEIPIIFESRREGESKISQQIIREGVVAPLKLFFKRLHA